MRVIICYHFFPHYRKGIIEKIPAGFHATFLGDDEGVEGIKTYPFPAEGFVRAKCYYFGKLMVQPRVILMALVGSYDTYVFLANPNHLSTWLAAGICRLRKKKVVFWGHGFKSSTLNNQNRLRKLFFSLANAFYTYGWRAKLNAVKLGFSPGSIHVGFNSLDYDAQLNTRNQILQAAVAAPDTPVDNEIIISCISRLTYSCRYDLLLEAASQIKKNTSLTPKIVIIGDGPEKEKLQQQTRALGLEVNFVGALYDESSIATHIFHSDVTVSPGKVGLTAMHSLMYGTPVISNNDFQNQMPEVEAIVPGFTGELFEKNNAASLAQSILTLRNASSDRHKTRMNCFSMIDEIYNPSKQLEVLIMAVTGQKASEGNDAFIMFERA